MAILTNVALPKKLRRDPPIHHASSLFELRPLGLIIRYPGHAARGSENFIPVIAESWRG